MKSIKLFTKLSFGVSLLLFFCGLFQSCAKDEVETMGTIYGIVNDANSGEPIQDAHVSLSPSGKTINTGSDGSYEFPEVEPGQYVIQITKTGYKTNTKRVAVVAGEKASGDMQLNRGTSRIQLSHSVLNFGSQSTSKTFTVRNISTSSVSVSWTVSKSSQASWMSVTPERGTTSYDKESTVVVNIDRSRIGKDETAILLVEADGESFPIEIAVSPAGSGGDNPDVGGGGSCGTITSYDNKLKTEFVQCVKIGTTVEFGFKILNTGDDVTLTFDTSSLKGYDDKGKAYDFNSSEFYVGGQRIYAGGTTSATFPKNVSVACRVVVKNVAANASFIARYEIVETRSTPWEVLNSKMQFENIRW